jgi:hypothetical protein
MRFGNFDKKVHNFIKGTFVTKIAQNFLIIAKCNWKFATSLISL